MNIYISGINHKTASIDKREKVSFTKNEIPGVLSMICKLQGVRECVVLSTCNRTEVYVYSDNEEFSNDIIENCICQLKSINVYEYRKHFYFYEGIKAVRHLFKVTSGLDSMILGEDQILGQVKDLHDVSNKNCACGAILNTLFRYAVTCAKKIKTSVKISENSLSVASIVCEHLSDRFKGSLQNKCAMIIGNGQMGNSVLKNMLDKNIGKVYLTMRKKTKCPIAQSDSKEHININYNDRCFHINECDIIISSTCSPHYTITKDMLSHFISTKKKRIFIDIAVPRDIDKDIKEFDNVEYYNIDDFKSVSDKNLDKRILEASKANKIIDDFILKFERWYEYRSVLPIITDIKEHARNELDKRVEYTISKLDKLCDTDKEHVRKSMTDTVNNILNTFMFGVREYGDMENIEGYLKSLIKAIKNEKQKEKKIG